MNPRHDQFVFNRLLWLGKHQETRTLESTREVWSIKLMLLNVYVDKGMNMAIACAIKLESGNVMVS